MALLSSSTFAILALACGFGTLAFGFLATHYKDKETLQMEKAHQNELTTKADQIAELNAKVIQLQAHGLKELSHQTGLLTGGSSFPVMALTNHNSPGAFTATIMVSGKYPLRDFSWRITVRQGAKASQTSGQVPTLRQITPLHPDFVVDVANDINTRVTVTFLANNGTWLQTFQFRRTEEGEYQFKTTLRPDNQRDRVLIETDFGEGVPFGSFEDLESIQYQGPTKPAKR